MVLLTTLIHIFISQLFRFVLEYSDEELDEEEEEDPVQAKLVREALVRKYGKISPDASEGEEMDEDVDEEEEDEEDDEDLEDEEDAPEEEFDVSL